MAYLDTFTAFTKPQYWTAAVYQRQSNGAYRFLRYTPPVLKKWNDFHVSMMNQYSLYAGYQTYQFYWDPLASVWIRESTKRPAVSGDSVGALERRSPLPPGRYWQDIFAKQAPAWDAWVRPKLADGSVVVEKFEHFRADPLRDGSWLPEVLQPDSPGKIAARTWVLFRVVRPVDWPSVELGFPTIADQSVQSSSDTALNPPGPSPLEEVGDAVKSAVVPVVGVLAALLGVKILLELRR